MSSYQGPQAEYFFKQLPLALRLPTTAANHPGCFLFRTSIPAPNARPTATPTAVHVARSCDVAPVGTPIPAPSAMASPMMLRFFAGGLVSGDFSLNYDHQLGETQLRHLAANNGAAVLSGFTRSVNNAAKARSRPSVGNNRSAGPNFSGSLFDALCYRDLVQIFVTIILDVRNLAQLLVISQDNLA